MSIDIVVPARDAAAYLPVCIRSVLRQTRADWRMAVVDDGSSEDRKSTRLNSSH